MTKVGKDTSNEWKVTLRDDGADGSNPSAGKEHRKFKVDSVKTCDGKELDITYNGATTGKNEYISAIITDKPITNASAKIEYYGRISNCASDSDVTDTISVGIEGKLGDGDTLYLFNEQYNGDKKTDYASALKEIEIPSATGHDWKFKNFTWTGSKTDGYTKAVANYVCQNNKKHSTTADAALTSRVTKPTCTKGGKTTYTATVSGADSPDGKAHSESKTGRITKAKGHTWKAATCTKPKTCSVCGVTTGKALGHKWGAWKVTKKPTTTAKGEKQRVCKNNSSHVQKKSIPTIKPVKKVIPLLLAKMTATGETGLKITWSKMPDAGGYDIFLSRCDYGKETYTPKKIMTIKGNKTFSWTKKDLKKKRAHKAVVKAWVMKNGKKQYIRTSPMVHAYTSGSNRLYTNSKSVTVKKTSISLTAGKSSKISAKVIKLRKLKMLMPESHTPKLRYFSSNKKIATVSGGKVTAESKGSCNIYVLAANGARKTVNVTVK